MENPFRVKPGEKLSLIKVLERFLDWEEWNRDRWRAHLQTGCDADLHSAHLCCADHMAYTAEYDAFFIYLSHLTHDPAFTNAVGFSMKSMRAFVREYDIEVTPRKVALYFGVTEKTWLGFLR